jgi:rare lipoprotein A
MKKLLILSLVVLCIFTNPSFGQQGKILVGTASFYAEKFDGRKTATGEVFSNKGLTCACNHLKLGTLVKVTNLKNNKVIVLKVNDRLAANNHRIIDVTANAAKQLGFFNAGLGKVKVEVIEKKTQNQSENKIVDIDSLVVSQKDTIFTTSEPK